MSAPLSSCSNDFNTQDENECFTIEHDQRTGQPGVETNLFSFSCPGLVNVTVNCCIWNELMFKKDSVISANAYRCEVVVCEEKVESIMDSNS